MTISTNTLEMLERHTRYTFAIVEDGIARRLDGTEIPVEHIARFTVPKDGMYRLSAAVCSGDNCSVGVPNPKCVRNGTYCPPKCAVYYFYSDIEDANVSIGQVVGMLHDMNEDAQ